MKLVFAFYLALKKKLDSTFLQAEFIPCRKLVKLEKQNIIWDLYLLLSLDKQNWFKSVDVWPSIGVVRRRKKFTVHCAYVVLQLMYGVGEQKRKL